MRLRAVVGVDLRAGSSPGVMTAVARAHTVEGMGKTILTIAGVVLAIWLLFTVIGAILSMLKFFFFIGFVAVIGYVAVMLISKSSKSFKGR
jgi:hypothetical protein